MFTEIMSKIKATIILIGFLLHQPLFSQDTIVLDKIIARIGEEIILKSDIEETYMQFLISGQKISKCEILENMLIEKILLTQAKIDSINVSDSEVESELNLRLNFFVNQLGSIEELEKYYNKPYYEIKQDLFKVVKEQKIVAKTKEKISGSVTITPAEVNEYFQKIPKNQLPIIDESYCIRVIYIYPKLSLQEEQEIKNQLNEIRDKITSGQRRFEAMARLYSQDLYSAKNGGEIGYVFKNELDPDFANVAFSLKPGEISQIVKSKYGYHIIQLIDRKGQKINVRHILIKPTYSNQTIEKTLKIADSIRNLIISNKMNFIEAVLKFSEDQDTRKNNGLIIDPQEESIFITTKNLDEKTKSEIDSLTEGGISYPIVSTDKYQNPVIKIYYLEKKIPSHIADIKNDYQIIHNKALNNKKEEIFNKWLDKTIKKTFIQIDKEYQNCNFQNKWLK